MKIELSDRLNFTISCIYRTVGHALHLDIVTFILFSLQAMFYTKLKKV